MKCINVELLEEMSQETTLIVTKGEEVFDALDAVREKFDELHIKHRTLMSKHVALRAKYEMLLRDSRGKHDREKVGIL